MAKWLSTLEKKLEEHSQNSHPEFRVFMSAEPAPSPEGHIIPQGILESAIKITSEPPAGMHANLHKALDNFTQVRPGRARGSTPPHRRVSRVGEEHEDGVGWGAVGTSWATGKRPMGAKCVVLESDLHPVPTWCNLPPNFLIHLGDLSLGSFLGKRCGEIFCKSSC